MFALLLIFSANFSAAAQGGRHLEDALRCAEQAKDDSARIYLHRARLAYEDADDLAGLINAHKELGKKFRTRAENKRPDEAVRIMRRAIAEQLCRQPVALEEWDALAWLYVNIAFSYNYNLADLQQAAEYYEKARNIFAGPLRLEDENVVRFVYRPLANLYTRFGERQAAEVLLERSRDFFLARDDFRTAAEINSDLATLWQSFGETERAARLYRESLGFPSLPPTIRVLLSSNLAKAQHSLGQLDAALNNAELSLKILGGLPPSEKSEYLKEWEAASLAQKAEILLSKRDYPRAEAAVVRAERLLQSMAFLNQRRSLGKLYILKGRIKQDQGDFEGAIAAYHESLSSILGDFQASDWRANPSERSFFAENTILEALSGKAGALFDWYRQAPGQDKLATALGCHELIFEVEQLLRRTHYYESSKLFNVEEARARSAHAIAIALELWKTSGEASYKDQALAFAERSKSTLLLEAFYKSKAETGAGLSREMLDAEKRLKQEISELEEKLFAARSSGAAKAELQALEKELLGLRQAYTNWVQSIEEEYPDYYRLKYDVQTLSSSQIRDKILGKGQAFVEYFAAERQIYVFVITHDKFEVLALPKDFPLEEQVVQFRQAIEGFQSDEPNREAHIAAYNQLGWALYQRLIAPLEKLGLPERLLIVPSGVLGFLPFDALLTAQPSGFNFSQYPYLIRRYAISQTYSAVLQAALLERPVVNRRLAGFAPHFPEGGPFAPLDNISFIEAVCRRNGGVPFRGDEASRAQLEAAAASFGLFHFASHAQANTEEGNFSFILLADGRGGHDSFFVKDIYLLPLQAEMAVLSACETNVGTLYQGEGIVSLARAFFYAGANSVITTLWKVNEEKNNELMLAFYRFLKKGDDKSGALRQAQLQLIEQGGKLGAHPAYWAAFAPIGNMRPVYPPLWPSWAAVLGTTALLLLGLVIYRRRRFRH